MPLTGVLPSRDSEIRVAIAKIGKTNAILECPVNKLFPFENVYQDINQTGVARQQNLRREAAVIGERKRNDEYQLREHWSKEIEHYKYEYFN